LKSAVTSRVTSGSPICRSEFVTHVVRACYAHRKVNELSMFVLQVLQCYSVTVLQWYSKGVSNMVKTA